MSGTPSVLFVCVKNGGKSQMAAGLMSELAQGSVEVRSAGTAPGSAINDLSAESLGELGIDITREVPKPITAQMVRSADVVIVLGNDAKVAEVEGTRFETWEVDEPSLRGIDGMERMRLVRGDIRQRVEKLLSELT